MKKILISLGFYLLSVSGALAQIQVQDNPPNWPFMLSNLNSSSISSGILLNKVADFSTLFEYNIGTNNTSNADHFTQGINELFYASDQTKFMSANQLKTIVAAAPGTTVDVGVVNTSLQLLNFNEKDPSAGGLTFANGKFVPVAGKSAFLTRAILLAAPLKNIVIGTSVTYRFSNAIIYNNVTSAIKNLVVYFNDTTPVTIISNGLVVLTSKTVSYAQSGDKLLTFVATFNDNTSFTTYGTHYFKYYNEQQLRAANSPIPCTDNLIDRGIFNSTLPFQGYTESVSAYGKLDYTVFYHTNNNNSQKTMLKPIIVIDGFDPGDKRKTTDCDCENDTTPAPNNCYLNNSTEFKTYPNGIFHTPVITRVFNTISYESIQDLMNYDVSENLIVKLRSEGYDVIILNIPRYNAVTTTSGGAENYPIDGGGDYIERNAYSLVSYLQSTKNQLLLNGSNEGIAMMGPSMGGLISRYALAYMEKKFAETNNPIWKHNTRIWVSFDSPHLGANVPVAAQANIWFFGNNLYNDSAKAKFENELNSPAGKQMLISQFQHTLNTMVNNIGQSNNSPFFTQFRNSLTSNGVLGSDGFPVSIPGTFRKIAIVNGSLNGTKNGTESAEFLNCRGYKDPSILEGAIGGAALGSVIPGLGTVGGAILGGIFGAGNGNVTLLRVRNKFYPAYGQTDDIFNGDGQNFDIGFDHWYINHKWYNLKGTNNDTRGSLDVVPGGTFNTPEIIKNEIKKGLEDKGLSFELRNGYQATHSFIPVFSALAHLQPNQNWSNPLTTNLACASNKLTPFDSYYGASSNTPHISLTKDMVDWLMKELGTNTTPPTPQAPYFPLEANLLTGGNVICENQIKTYQFNDICKIPGKATFTVVGNLTIISSTDYSVTIKGGLDGQAKIIADFGNGLKYEKNIRVGAPSISSFAIQGGNNTVPYGNVSTFTVTPSPNIISPENYQWSIIPISSSCLTLGELYLPGATPPLFLSGNGNTSITVNWGTCAGTYILRCAITNECMRPVWYSDKVIKVFNQATNNPCASKIVLTPNPLKNSDALVLNIAQPVPTAPCQSGRISSKTEIYSVEIYNLQSIKVYSGKINPNTNELTNFNLVRGIYVVHATASDGEIYKEKLIVE